MKCVYQMEREKRQPEGERERETKMCTSVCGAADVARTAQASESAEITGSVCMWAKRVTFSHILCSTWTFY